MKKSFIFAALAAAIGLQAEVIGEIATAKDLSLPDRCEVIGEKQFKVKKLGWFVSTKKYPIDPKKSYRITGEFRIAPGAAVKGKYSLGFYSVDGKGRVINVSNVTAYPGSETELAAAVNVGDKVFKIKDGSKWSAKNGYIAFDVDPSGKMRDLPCFSVCNFPVTRVGKKGDVWEVEVTRPVKTAYAAGVAVREHQGGWSFLSSNSTVPSAEWQKTSWTVKPGAVKKNTRSQWLFGAEKFIAVLVVPAGVEFRNVTIESLD